MEAKIAYWQPRVMRHTSEAGYEEYAVHEVYFGASGQVVTYTEDALSTRETSAADLKIVLSRLLAVPELEKVCLGDLNYAYSQEDIRFWLEYVDQSPIDYERTSG